MFSNLACSNILKRILFVGELPLKNNVSSLDYSVKCRYPDSVDVR
jgi:hypothetical protein